MTVFKSSLKKCVTTCLAISVFATFVTHAEPIWQGKGKNSDDYLIGTIHLGDERLKTLPISIQQVIDKIDVVAVEVDLSTVTKEMQQQEMVRLGMLPQGTNLTDLISLDVANQINEYFQSFDMNINQYQRLKPWMVAIVMVQMSYQKQGLVAEYGIDQQIIDYAKSQNKKVIQLETFSQQLNLFNRLFDNSQNISYDDMLIDTLDELKNMSDLPSVMLNAWLTADMKVFEDIYQKTLKATKYDNELEKILLIERNQAWAKVLNPLFEEQSVVVATGTLHYVGKTGLPKLLNASFQMTNKND